MVSRQANSAPQTVNELSRVYWHRTGLTAIAYAERANKALKLTGREPWPSNRPGHRQPQAAGMPLLPLSSLCMRATPGPAA